MIVHLHSVNSGDSSNPPAIILHGLFGSSSNWRSIARQLSSRFQVFCVDLRNHGKSGWNDAMGYLDMAQDLATFIADNGLNGARLIGHSMGGKTVMAYLQHHNPDAGKAVIVDIAPTAYLHDYDQLINALQKLELEGLTSRNEADRRLSQDIADASVRQFLLQNLVRGESGFAWRVNLAAIARNRSSLLTYPEGQPSHAETLFIRGSNSNYVLPEHCELITRLFPNSRIRTMEGAGHWLHAEKPGELAEWLFEYFE